VDLAQVRSHRPLNGLGHLVEHGWRSCAASTVDGACRGRPRRWLARSRARRRRPRSPARWSARAASPRPATRASSGRSREPHLEADEFLLPLGRGADQTSMHSAWLSIRACR
jgi:hypothetical protein